MQVQPELVRQTRRPQEVQADLPEEVQQPKRSGVGEGSSEGQVQDVKVDDKKEKDKDKDEASSEAVESLAGSGEDLQAKREAILKEKEGKKSDKKKDKVKRKVKGNIRVLSQGKRFIMCDKVLESQASVLVMEKMGLKGWMVYSRMSICLLRLHFT